MQPKMFYKDFDGWVKVAKNIERDKKMPTFREGEVWWCSVGTNIGVEICGKGKTRIRPVLVLKKFNRNFFMGIPFTSKTRTGSWYANVDLRGKRQTALLAQAKVMSSYRLHNKMGQLPEPDFYMVKKRFRRLYK